MTDLVLSIDQPYATLIMLGVKRFETRPSPPNGDMRPAGVRGLPGATLNRGDRLYIASTLRKADVAKVGMAPYRPLLAPGSEVVLAAPLVFGSILGLVTVTDAYPIESIDPDGPWPSEASLSCGQVVYTWRHQLTFTDRFVAPPDDTDITDQLPFGDWTPGRWAWALTDPEPLPEPIRVTGKQGVWRWEP